MGSIEAMKPKKSAQLSRRSVGLGTRRTIKHVYLTGRFQESRWLYTRPTKAATKKMAPTRMAIPLVERTELFSMLGRAIPYHSKTREW